MTFRNLTLLLPDRPGMAAEIGEALGRAGITAEGFCGFVVGNSGFAHLLVEDGEAARRALDGVVDIAEEQEALVIQAATGPGTLGRVTRAIANAGVNMRFLYLATGNRIVVGAQDLDRAREAVAGLDAASS